MKAFTLILTCCFFFNSLNSSAQQPGTLDYSFNNHGTIAFKDAVPDSGTTVAVTTDGHILVAYSVGHGFNVTGLKDNGKIYNAFGAYDGVIDGKSIIAISGDDHLQDMVLQPDGKIVLAGYTGIDYNHPKDFAIARLNADGSPDSSFNANGRQITKLTDYDDFGKDIALQTNGKIVVAGYVWNGTNYDFALVRYKFNNGKLDSTFGVNGLVISDFKNINNIAYSVAMQSNGKIIAAGWFDDGVDRDFALVRYNIDGTIDSSFGKNGIRLTNFGGNDFIKAITIKSDDKIIAVGGSDGKFALAQYKSNGMPDKSFGIKGKITYNIELDGQARAIAIQPDGKLVVVGDAFFDDPFTPHGRDFVVATFKSNGELDSAFGNFYPGYALLNEHYDYGTNVVLQPDGKILMGGQWSSGFGTSEIARYFADNTAGTANFLSNKILLPQQNNSKLYLSPNPVKDVLHLQGLSNNKKTIYISNLSGKIFLQASITNNQYSFNIENLIAGVYYVSVEENKKTSSLKFIKN